MRLFSIVQRTEWWSDETAILPTLQCPYFCATPRFTNSSRYDFRCSEQRSSAGAQLTNWIWIMFQDSSFYWEGKMIIGVPKEIKEMENRVGASCRSQWVDPNGNQCLLKQEPSWKRFCRWGLSWCRATITDNVREYGVLKWFIRWKNRLRWIRILRSDLMLFTYLHLAAEGPLTKALVDNKVNSVAYETVQLEDGSLPPDSDEWSRRPNGGSGWSTFLEKPQGGQGVLLGGVPGYIQRGGYHRWWVVGINSAKMAVGMGARVTILDVSAERMRHLDDVFNGRVELIMSNSYNIAEAVESADLLIGGAIPGAKAPHLVTEAMVKTMKPGSVIVDVAIDQGDYWNHRSRDLSQRSCLRKAWVVIIRLETCREQSLEHRPLHWPMSLCHMHLLWQARLRGCLSWWQGPRTCVNTMDGNVTCEGVASSLGYSYSFDNLIWLFGEDSFFLLPPKSLFSISFFGGWLIQLLSFRLIRILPEQINHSNSILQEHHLSSVEQLIEKARIAQQVYENYDRGCRWSRDGGCLGFDWTAEIENCHKWQWKRRVWGKSRIKFSRMKEKL